MKTRTFNLFYDWVDQGEEHGVHPVLKDGYKAFGFLQIACNDHVLTVQDLKSLYRKAGLKNNNKRDAAIQWLLDNHTILETIPAYDYDELKAYLSSKYLEQLRNTGGKFNEDTFEDYKANLSYKKDKTGLTIHDPALNIDAVILARKGFKKVKASLYTTEGINKHAGKIIQVYLYLVLSATRIAGFKEYPGFNGKTIKNHMFVGDVFTSSRTIGKRLGLSRQTVDFIMEELIGLQLITPRKSTKGGPSIHRVKECEPVVSKKKWKKKK